ncbi:MAG: hypothetical protein Q7R39_09965 [Dehalococcoidia bacterium]|nr:hypothetical protein [Dehalococcoidia bacterium]
MKLSKKLKAYLTSELRTTAEMMEKQADPRDKVYYLSAAYGAAHRTFNIEYSSELVLLWLVLKSVHGMVATRLESLKTGAQLPLQIPKEVFEHLPRLLVALADRIDANDNYVELLERISAVAYTCEGNGYYLHSTNRLQYE